MKGYIRIRTPDDPDGWTAQGDLVPGVPYTYTSGDVAVVVDWDDVEPRNLDRLRQVAAQPYPLDARVIVNLADLRAAMDALDGVDTDPETVVTTVVQDGSEPAGDGPPRTKPG